MKKIILSIAIIASVFLMTNINVANASEKPTISIVTEDDGFVEVSLQDLNENVQASIKSFTNEYDVKSLKYNAEKQLTKVELIKKDDQSSKKVLLNDSGEKVEKDKSNDRNVERQETQQLEQIQQPSFQLNTDFEQNDGFVETKLENLNDNVQSAIRELGSTHEVATITYNKDTKVTKVKSTNRADQTEKVFSFDDEGKEVQPETKNKELERTIEQREIEQRVNIETQLPKW